MRQNTWGRTGYAIAFSLFYLSGCASPTAPAEPRLAVVHSGPPPSATESYCAWYAEVGGDVFYFGEAAFWSAMHAAGGEPTADLYSSGPQPIGRFDLKRERLLPPLEVGESLSDSGVWDVLPHPNGLVYFTTFYESAGAVNPATGEVKRFPELGRGLNELALGADGNIVVSRYGGHGGSDQATGALVVFSPAGELVLEAELKAPPGLVLAPKTVAWDGDARRYWIVTDLVWRDMNQPAPVSMHPAVVLDERGAEIARIDEVELHFVRFAQGGRGVAVTEADGELRLIELDASPAATQLGVGRGLLLDAKFPGALDFVQDVAFGPRGEVLVTRWSGLVHVVELDPTGAGRAARVLDVQLPREDGLFYASALTPERRVCTTLCHDRALPTDLASIDVVCAPVEPAHGTTPR